MVAGILPEPRLIREIDFKVIKEEWLTIKLKDGSIIKFKPILVKVFETDAKDQVTGEPILSFEGQNIVTVRSPQNLRGNPSERIPSPDEALRMDKEEVEIVEMIDPSWNLYELETGKRIKSKPVIISVYKIKGIFDRYGNPFYVVRSQMVIGSSPYRLEPLTESSEGYVEKWLPLPQFSHKHPLEWEIPAAPPKVESEKPTRDFTILSVAIQKRFVEKRTSASIEMFLEDIHRIVKGRLKDWKEEEHLADNLLFRLVKRE